MISVIMPIFNSALYLEKAVCSVFGGGVGDIELIAIDDCSTDSSRSILAALAEKDGRIRLIFNENNVGVSAVRSLGIREARGEYIAFCDSDDEVEPGAYRILLDTLGGRDVAVGAYLDLTDSGGERRIVPPRGGGMIETLFSGSSLWHKLFRADFIKKAGITFDEGLSLGEDVVFLSRLALAHPTLAVTDKTVYRYYHHDTAAGESLTHSFTLSRFEAHIKCRQMMLDLLSAEYPAVRDYLYNHFVDYLDRFIPFIEGGEDRQRAFLLYKEFMSGYPWEEHPREFLALTGVCYSRFLECDAYSYLQAKYDILPRDRVYHEFGTGKIGLRWIVRYFVQWLKFKFR